MCYFEMNFYFGDGNLFSHIGAPFTEILTAIGYNIYTYNTMCCVRVLINQYHESLISRSLILILYLYMYNIKYKCIA